MRPIEQAIKDAVEKGGYAPDEFRTRSYWRTRRPIKHLGRSTLSASLCTAEIFLDPAFWQALGKARGWKEEGDGMGCLARPGEIDGVVQFLCNRHTPTYYAHLFFDWIIAGREAESFFASLV